MTPGENISHFFFYQATNYITYADDIVVKETKPARSALRTLSALFGYEDTPP